VHVDLLTAPLFFVWIPSEEAIRGQYFLVGGFFPRRGVVRLFNFSFGRGAMPMAEVFFLAAPLSSQLGTLTRRLLRGQAFFPFPSVYKPLPFLEEEVDLFFPLRSTMIVFGL